MKVIIAGTRTITDRIFVENVINVSDFNITTVLSGAARGVDETGERWAEGRGIPVRKFPADWKKWGNSAGYRRNMEMAIEGDALIACWDKKSAGTENMIRLMRAAGKPVEVTIVESRDKKEGPR